MAYLGSDYSDATVQRTSPDAKKNDIEDDDDADDDDYAQNDNCFGRQPLQSQALRSLTWLKWYLSYLSYSDTYPPTLPTLILISRGKLGVAGSYLPDYQTTIQVQA